MSWSCWIIFWWRKSIEFPKWGYVLDFGSHIWNVPLEQPSWNILWKHNSTNVIFSDAFQEYLNRRKSKTHEIFGFTFTLCSLSIKKFKRYPTDIPILHLNSNPLEYCYQSCSQRSMFSHTDHNKLMFMDSFQDKLDSLIKIMCN